MKKQGPGSKGFGLLLLLTVSTQNEKRMQSCAAALLDWNERQKGKLVSLMKKLDELHHIIHSGGAEPGLSMLKDELNEAENQLIDTFFIMDNRIRPSLEVDYFDPECEADAVNRYKAFVETISTHEANYECMCKLLASYLLT